MSSKCFSNLKKENMIDQARLFAVLEKQFGEWLNAAPNSGTLLDPKSLKIAVFDLRRKCIIVSPVDVEKPLMCLVFTASDARKVHHSFGRFNQTSATDSGNSVLV